MLSMVLAAEPMLLMSSDFKKKKNFVFVNASYEFEINKDFMHFLHYKTQENALF